MSMIYLNANDEALAARAAGLIDPAAAVLLARDALEELRLLLGGQHAVTQTGDAMAVDLGGGNVLKLSDIVQDWPQQDTVAWVRSLRWESGGVLRASIAGDLFLDYTLANGQIGFGGLTIERMDMTMPDQRGGDFTIGGEFWDFSPDGRLTISKTELTLRPGAGPELAHMVFYPGTGGNTDIGKGAPLPGSWLLEQLSIDYSDGQQETFDGLNGYFDRPVTSFASATLLAQGTGLSGDDRITVRDAAILDDGGHIRAGSGNDRIHVGRGSFAVDGGAGIDTVQYDGVRALSAISAVGGALKVSNVFDGDAADTLVNVERVRFADVTVAFDIDGTAGQLYRLYDAAFGRMPDRAGLAAWIAALDQGSDLLAAARGFLSSTEFTDRYGTSLSDEAFVRQLYPNVLDREPDAAGAAYWTGQLAGGMERAQLLAGFSESEEHQALLIGEIRNGIEF